ncbi:MAG: dephospho-CoA kinase [Acidobacteria bacterium]|nr:dephospho-CoA kinase [Acidobacteriota bacterium]MCZ6751948.1 dephospho-CoA kinase [Acidobacteriota bacterium]
MISVGLTGGIGCGKSTVAGMFASLGAVTINSDDIGRTLMQPGNVVYDRIVSGFGSEMVDASGQLDRAKLADIVFHDLEKLKHLSAIVHAPVLREIDRQVQLARRKDPNAVILVESAVLFEAGQNRRFDKMVVVWCNPEQQVERYVAKSRIAVEDVRRRMDAQMPGEEKKRLADFVIDTSGPMEDSEKQSGEVFTQLQTLAAAQTRSTY